MKSRFLSILFLVGSTFLPNAYLCASTLKVYNMTDRPLFCYTKPFTACDNHADNCVVSPYQSIFHPHAKLLELQHESIEQFIWKGIVGPQYKAIVNLLQDEFATIEILDDGYYKFKGTKFKAERF